MAIVKSRFAPSPTGRMHLGNLMCALMSWLTARALDGVWVLRIEDLDPQRSRPEYARQIEDDLRWFGLEWDEGGLDNRGNCGPYVQSERHHIYRHYLDRLIAAGHTYPCYCTRAQLHVASAPHASDGRLVYPGTCRPDQLPTSYPADAPKAALRLAVPDINISFNDLIQGPQSFNLKNEWGDFILRRADSAWAYQLAVTIDDALMGITHVVRGEDLLSSSAPQICLHQLLKFTPPSFAHIPLITNEQGIRLSKRDNAMALDALRSRYTPSELCGLLASLAKLQPDATPVRPIDLITSFRNRFPALCSH